jgi:hypothetical protein
LRVRRNKLYAFYKSKIQVRSCRKRETCEILPDNLRHIFLMKSYEKIRRVEGKEDIFENSGLTCFCKILGSGSFLQVKLIIIMK